MLREYYYYLVHIYSNLLTQCHSKQSMENGAIGNQKNVISHVTVEPSWDSEVVIIRLLSMEVIDALGFSMKGFRAMSIFAQVYTVDHILLNRISIGYNF